MEYLQVFLTGGSICAIAQILIDKTKLTPARILVLFVTLGCILTAFGVYDNIVSFGQSGATVPLSGFGYALTTGTLEAIEAEGFIGIFTGAIKNTAGGISAAIIFGYILSIFSKPTLK